MDIGEPRKTIVIEPLEDPVPRETPLEAEEHPEHATIRDSEKVSG